MVQLGEYGSYRFLQVNTTVVGLEGKELISREPDSALLDFLCVGEGGHDGLLFFHRELSKWNGLA